MVGNTLSVTHTHWRLTGSDYLTVALSLALGTDTVCVMRSFRRSFGRFTQQFCILPFGLKPFEYNRRVIRRRRCRRQKHTTRPWNFLNWFMYLQSSFAAQKAWPLWLNTICEFVCRRFPFPNQFAVCWMEIYLRGMSVVCVFHFVSSSSYSSTHHRRHRRRRGHGRRRCSSITCCCCCYILRISLLLFFITPACLRSFGFVSHVIPSDLCSENHSVGLFVFHIRMKVYIWMYIQYLCYVCMYVWTYFLLLSSNLRVLFAVLNFVTEWKNIQYVLLYNSKSRRYFSFCTHTHFRPISSVSRQQP